MTFSERVGRAAARPTGQIRGGIDLKAWRTEFGATGSSFADIRRGRDVRTVTLARLVRSARKITGKPVRASDLYDVGDDAPIEPVRRPRTARHASRTFYDTPLDRFLVRENIGPAVLAREASVARQAFRHIRAGSEHPRISTVRKLVATLRLLTGKPIRAAELFDLGEEDVEESTGE